MPIYCYKMDIIKGSSNFVEYGITTRGTSRILSRFVPKSNGDCSCMFPSKGVVLNPVLTWKKSFFHLLEKSDENILIAYRYKKDYLVEIVVIRIKAVCELKARLMASNI